MRLDLAGRGCLQESLWKEALGGAAGDHEDSLEALIDAFKGAAPEWQKLLPSGAPVPNIRRPKIVALETEARTWCNALLAPCGVEITYTGRGSRAGTRQFALQSLLLLKEDCETELGDTCNYNIVDIADALIPDHHNPTWMGSDYILSPRSGVSEWHAQVMAAETAHHGV